MNYLETLREAPPRDPALVRTLTHRFIHPLGFVAYALVESGTVAAVLYVVDHLFFALAIAMRTYFQKIADPADIAATAGVSFTINHIAAVLLPAAYGLLWLVSPALVFLSGALLATMSLALSILVPHDPREGNEVWTDFTPIGVRSATTS